MHANLNNFVSQPQPTVTLNYFIRTLDAKGVRLTREQFTALTAFNDKIPLKYLNDYDKIGALTKIVPELDQKLLVSDANVMLKTRIPGGTPQLPLQYGKMLRNHELQQVFVGKNESVADAVDNEVAAKIVKAYDRYNHQPYYSRTQDQQITTGATYTHIPESRFSLPKSDFFKGIDQSFNIDTNPDILARDQVRFTPKVASNIKNVLLTNKGKNEMTISYRDGGKRVIEFEDSVLKKNLNNNSSIYAQAIPQYNPSLANMTVPDLDNKILRTIFLKKNPNKISPQERSAIINSTLYGVSTKRPDINSTGLFDGYKQAVFNKQTNYKLLQDSMTSLHQTMNHNISRDSWLKNRWPALQHATSLKRMADLNNDSNTSHIIKKLKDNAGAAHSFLLKPLEKVSEEDSLDGSVL